jgi:hypothetical protein
MVTPRGVLQFDELTTVEGTVTTSGLFAADVETPAFVYAEAAKVTEAPVGRAAGSATPIDCAPAVNAAPTPLAVLQASETAAEGVIAGANAPPATTNVTVIVGLVRPPVPVKLKVAVELPVAVTLAQYGWALTLNTMPVL